LIILYKKEREIDMYGYRKFILGLVYLGISFWLAMAAVNRGLDLVGIATIIAAMSTGVGVIIWGNIQSNKAIADSKNGNGNGNGDSYNNEEIPRNIKLH